MKASSAITFTPLRSSAIRHRVRLLCLLPSAGTMFAISTSALTLAVQVAPLASYSVTVLPIMGSSSSVARCARSSTTPSSPTASRRSMRPVLVPSAMPITMPPRPEIQVRSVSAGGSCSSGAATGAVAFAIVTAVAVVSVSAASAPASGPIASGPSTATSSQPATAIRNIALASQGVRIVIRLSASRYCSRRATPKCAQLLTSTLDVDAQTRPACPRPVGPPGDQGVTVSAPVNWCGSHQNGNEPAAVKRRHFT